MECTHPQYIIRATDPNYHTEIFAVAPGAAPSIVNQIPPGKPTVPNGPQEEMLQSITKILADGGFCTIPKALDEPAVEGVEDTSSGVNVPDGLGALGENMARRTQSRAIEEVPATPDIYLQKTENIATPGTGGSVLATVLAIPLAVAGGKLALSRVQQQMFPVTVQPEVQSYESEQPENIYTRPQPAASVSAVPTHEPKPWASVRAHARNPHQAVHFDRNDSPKWTRNDSEMTPKQVRNDSEMSLVSTEMDSINPEQLDRVRNRLSGLFRNAESVTTQVISDETVSEMKSVSTYFDTESDLTQAKSTYFMLREQGIHTATDLGGAIFGIRGGDKWSKVSPILRDWNSEWEGMNGTGIG